MRPEIPDELANRVADLDERHGYKSVGEFVRETVRDRVAQLEAAQSLSDTVGIPIGAGDIEFKPQLSKDQQDTLVEERCKDE